MLHYYFILGSDTIWKVVAVCCGITFGIVILTLWIWYELRYKKRNKRKLPKIVVSNEKFFLKTGVLPDTKSELVGELHSFDCVIFPTINIQTKTQTNIRVYQHEHLTEFTPSDQRLVLPR